GEPGLAPRLRRGVLQGARVFLAGVNWKRHFRRHAGGDGGGRGGAGQVGGAAASGRRCCWGRFLRLGAGESLCGTLRGRELPPVSRARSVPVLRFQGDRDLVGGVQVLAQRWPDGVSNGAGGGLGQQLRRRRRRRRCSVPGDRALADGHGVGR
ncbi:unnamed protein product, partial [Ectocarpus sp. 4 AP-2014]